MAGPAGTVTRSQTPSDQALGFQGSPPGGGNSPDAPLARHRRPRPCRPWDDGALSFRIGNLHRRYGAQVLNGEAIMCLGNTESRAGSDVAAIAMQAEAVSGGWKLNGIKSFVTNGAVADLAVVTAVTDPAASRSHRLSMFLVDLHQRSATHPSKQQVWLPSDLTRLELREAEVPEDHLLGRRGRGLAQVLAVFTHSRVAITALTLARRRRLRPGPTASREAHGLRPPDRRPPGEVL